MPPMQTFCPHAGPHPTRTQIPRTAPGIPVAPSISSKAWDDDGPLRRSPPWAILRISELQPRESPPRDSSYLLSHHQGTPRKAFD